MQVGPVDVFVVTTGRDQDDVARATQLLESLQSEIHLTAFTVELESPLPVESPVLNKWGSI